MNSIKMTLGRERREDLNHGDWDDPVTEVVDADERPAGSPPQSSRRSMADTPPLDADSPQPDKVTPGTTGSWDVVDGEDNGLGHFLVQASDLPQEGDQADQDDSYQVISSNTARGPEKQFRVHLLTLRASAWAAVGAPEAPR